MLVCVRRFLTFTGSGGIWYGPHPSGRGPLDARYTIDSSLARTVTGTGGGNRSPEVASPILDIQILHIQSILFNKLAPCLHVLAHQGGEDGLALGNIFELHREQSPPLRIHGRLP